MARLQIRWNIVVGLAAACVLFAVGPAVADTIPSADSLVKPAEEGPPQIPEIIEAYRCVANSDMEGAYESAKKAAKSHPELPPAEAIMAQIMIGLKQGQAARVWLERAVQESPGDPQAYVLLGQDALGTGRLAEAELLLKKASELGAAFQGDAGRKEQLQVVSLSLLARVAMLRKDWSTAQTRLEELLTARPSDSGALQMLAQSLFEQKKPAEALEKLKQAKTADEQMLTPEAVLAQWYEQTGDHAKAGDYMVAALKAQPKDFQTRVAAAEWALGAQDFTQAREQIDYALTLQPNSVQANFLAGGIAIFQKDFAAAEKYLTAALAAAPANVGARNNLAIALAEQDDKAKQQLALQHAQVNLAMDQNNAEALSTLGRVLFRLGRLQEAEAALNKASAVARSKGQGLSPDTVFYFADLYAQTDRKDKAVKLLQDALKAPGLFAAKADAEALLQRLSK